MYDIKEKGCFSRKK